MEAAAARAKGLRAAAASRRPPRGLWTHADLQMRYEKPGASYMGAPLSLAKYAVQRAAANSSVHPQPSSSHASRKRRHLLEPPPLSSLTRAAQIWSTLERVSIYVRSA